MMPIRAVVKLRTRLVNQSALIRIDGVVGGLAKDAALSGWEGMEVAFAMSSRRVAMCFRSPIITASSSGWSVE